MTGDAGASRLYHLIQAIQEHTEFDHPVDHIELVETHISYVLLTGRYAYKFKKPLDLGFLDFSTLDKRKFYCEEEVRLNRRFAPEIYLGVIAITEPEDHPVMAGTGEPIEYSVKMIQFPKGVEFDHLLESGRLMPVHIDDLAQQIANFHETAAIAPKGGPFGTPADIREATLANFAAIRPAKQAGDFTACLNRLEQWTLAALDDNTPRFIERRDTGFIRECHGDLHLGNIALYRNKPVVFDCIEFSEKLRWIDVISEIAFLVMDLDARDWSTLAYRLLNDYLGIRGDYEGLRLLQFYRVYRALVRCKIACIRMTQGDLGTLDRRKESRRARHYLELAGCYIQPARPALFITHGLSGSGKSTWSQQLLESIGAIRVRSDVERKRLHGLDADAKSNSGLQSNIYSRASTQATYNRLEGLARIIIEAGYPAIVDATFLEKDTRSQFQRLAEMLNVPFLILDFRAQEDVLRKRVKERKKSGNDASEAGLDVLEYQIKNFEPLGKGENAFTVTVNEPLAIEKKNLNQALERIMQLTGIKVVNSVKKV